MKTIPDGPVRVNPPIPAPLSPKPHGFAETLHLEVDSFGLLYLKEHAIEADDHVKLGHIEGADVPQEYAEEFVWLLGEWRDGARFSQGCEDAAHEAFRAGLGDVSKW